MKKAFSVLICFLMLLQVAVFVPFYSFAQTDVVTQTVSLGSNHSAAIKTDGSLWLWGNNDYGQIGNGTTTGQYTPIKIMDNVASVSLGGSRSAAIKTDGSLWLWGNNYYGQIGNGTTTDQYTPVKIMDNVASVSLGGSHSAAIKTDGSLWLWGFNYYGQIGNTTTDHTPTPVKIMDNVASVSLGGDYSAAIKTDGSLWLWGENEYGQIGNGTTTDQKTPAKIMDNVAFVSIEDGSSAAIKQDGSLWMWGLNDSDQINNTGSYDNRFVKSPTKIMDNITSFSSSLYTSFAIKDNSLWMWGCEKTGHFNSFTRSEPTKIMDNVASVSLGFEHYAAIKNDGSLWLWGVNCEGQVGEGTKIIGDGYFDNAILTPTKIMDDVASVSLVGGVSAAIKTDGSLWMWGNNENGQIGNGTTINQYTPVKIMDNVMLHGTAPITPTPTPAPGATSKLSATFEVYPNEIQFGGSLGFSGNVTTTAVGGLKSLAITVRDKNNPTNGFEWFSVRGNDGNFRFNGEKTFNIADVHKPYMAPALNIVANSPYSSYIDFKPGMELEVTLYAEDADGNNLGTYGITRYVKISDGVKVTLPAYNVYLNGKQVQNNYAVYPCFVYKDITYIPMTYNISNALGLDPYWSAETGIIINLRSGYSSVPDIELKNTTNPTTILAEIAKGKVTVNGKVINNEAEEYPLLTYNNITYFPLTWRFTVQEFGWTSSFDGKTLSVNSGTNHIADSADTEAPTVSIISSQTTFAAGQEVTLHFDFRDNSELSKYTVHSHGVKLYEGALSGKNGGAIAPTFTFNAVSGLNSIEVRVWDKSGNMGSDQISFTASDKPVINIMGIDSSGTYKEGVEYDVIIKFSDDSGLARYEISGAYTESGELSDTFAHTGFCFSPSRHLPRYLTVEVWDIDGNKTVKQINFEISYIII